MAAGKPGPTGRKMNRWAPSHVRGNKAVRVVFARVWQRERGGERKRDVSNALRRISDGVRDASPRNLVQQLKLAPVYVCLVICCVRLILVIHAFKHLSHLGGGQLKVLLKLLRRRHHPHPPPATSHGGLDDHRVSDSTHNARIQRERRPEKSCEDAGESASDITSPPP